MESNEEKTRRTIEERQNKDKTTVLEHLKMTPIVQVACNKAGIGHATYYRWRKEDENFKKAADDALTIGVFLINDIAESQLIALIKEKRFPAITYWLNNHNMTYSNKTNLGEATTTKMSNIIITREGPNAISASEAQTFFDQSQLQCSATT